MRTIRRWMWLGLLTGMGAGLSLIAFVALAFTAVPVILRDGGGVFAPSAVSVIMLGASLVAGGILAALVLPLRQDSRLENTVVVASALAFWCVAWILHLWTSHMPWPLSIRGLLVSATLSATTFGPMAAVLLRPMPPEPHRED